MAFYNNASDLQGDIPLAGGAGNSASDWYGGAKKSGASWWDSMGPGSNNYDPKQYGLHEAYFDDPNAAANKSMLSQALADRNMVRPAVSQAATVDPSQQDQFRGQQQMLANQLAMQANGQGPSLAQMQMQRGMDQATASQHAMAASASGIPPALAQRMAAQNIAGLQGQGAYNAGMMSMQEQMAARQQLGDILSGGRGQDIGLAGTQAGFQQQTGLANQQAAIEAQRQKDAMAQYYTSAGLGIDQNAMNAHMAEQQLESQNYNAAMNAKAGISAQNAQAGSDWTGKLIGAGATLGAAYLMSDKRNKTDIESGDEEVGEFLDALDAKSFRYKGHPSRFAGFMAQDAERSSLGRELVRETSVGKVIDSSRLAMALTAAAANLNKRVRELEGQK